MISTLVAAAEQQRKKPVVRVPGLIADFPFDKDFKDRLGYMDSTPYGVNAGLLSIAQIQGRGALFVERASMGLKLTVPQGKKKLMTPDLDWWAIEFEVMILNLGAVKHDSILALYDTDWSTESYKLWAWKRYQSSNTLIFNLIGSTSETAPPFSDSGRFPANTFRKFRIEKEKGTNWLVFYINGVYAHRQQIASRDYTTNLIDILSKPTPNNFTGYIRDLKVYG